MSDTRSLHRKLAQVMYEAERIPKRGKAPQVMGGYEFVQVGDAADFIRKALSEKVLTMMPTKIEVVGQVDRPTKSGGSMTTLDLRVEWTISDGESGESITIESFGAGADGGDKYSGKAMTNAMKYALLAGFLLSTGDDVELGTHEAGAPKRSQSEPIREAVKSDEPEYVGPWTGTGKVMIRKVGPADGNIRNSPEFQFMRFAFSTTEDELIPQVEVRGSLIHAILDAEGGPLDGLVATISGDLYRVSFTPSGSSKPQTFQRLVLSHIKTPAWELPVPVAPGQVGAFDAETEAELDGAL